VKEIPNVHVTDIDGLAGIVELNKKAREEEIPRAIALVEEQIDGFMRWQAGVAACTVSAELLGVPEQEREAILRQHLQAMPHLSAQERVHFVALIEKFLKGSKCEGVAFPPVSNETQTASQAGALKSSS